MLRWSEQKFAIVQGRKNLTRELVPNPGQRVAPLYDPQRGTPSLVHFELASQPCSEGLTWGSVPEVMGHHPRGGRPPPAGPEPESFPPPESGRKACANVPSMHWTIIEHQGHVSGTFRTNFFSGQVDLRGRPMKIFR